MYFFTLERLLLLLKMNCVTESVKVMLHGAIRNDDFQRIAALECWSNIVTIRDNVAAMLPRCIALKIVVANRLV